MASTPMGDTPYVSWSGATGLWTVFKGTRALHSTLNEAEAKLYCEQLTQWNPDSWNTGPLDQDEVARVGRNIREVFGLHSREAAMYALLAAKPIKED